MALEKKKKKKEKYSKEFLQEIKMLDFLGQLTPDQAEIAKENGLFRWDLTKKVWNLVEYKDQSSIKNYADLSAYLEKKTAIL